MTVNAVELPGCRPDVLAHYLKALAVFRLVAQQKDPEARGFWRDGTFVLVTSLDPTAIETFFLDHYAPAPLVAPWNGGSGFFPRDNQEAIDEIRTSHAARLDLYRCAIGAAAATVAGRDQRPEDEEKLALIERARREWPTGLLPWLDSALSLSEDAVRYPALLGTGGNDGRLDFTNNFMQRILELFDPTSGVRRPSALALLRGSLFGEPTAGLQSDIAIGQFLPGAAGGANATSGFKGLSLVNAWDFVFALEGALSFQVAAVRRLDAVDRAQAAAPFAVRTAAAGYASAASSDESARGEQWMPLWSSPTTWRAFQRLVSEARLLSGRSSAGSAIEAAAALSDAGAARGITAFQRFGFIERNGQANLAVPLGVWSVEQRPTASLFDAVERWVNWLRVAADAPGAPIGMSRQARVIQAGILGVLQHPTAQRVEHLLVGLGEAEDAIARSGRWAAERGLRPLPAIDESIVAPWLVTDDPETEIARCLAALEGPARSSLRWNCLPLGDGPAAGFRAGSDGLLDSPDIVWSSEHLATSLAAIVTRRLHQAGGFPFSAPRFTVRLSTIDRFIAGDLDDRRIARLARPLMAIRWSTEDHPLSSASTDVDPRFAICRLAWNGVPLSDGRLIADASIPKLLSRGKGREAIRAAERRLAATGLRLRIDSQVHAIALDDRKARRFAAALVLPISKRDSVALIAAFRRQPEAATS